MIFQIKSENDLRQVELQLLCLLRSSRLDASLFKSKSYIDMKKQIFHLLESDIECDKSLPNQFYFHNENIVISILSTKPILVWCGEKEWICETI